MSEFNPALIVLANIYADAFDSRQTTEVYANDVMQVSIFVSVNYKGNASGIEDEIKDYVRDKAVIYRLMDNGGKEEVDWVYSDTSNGFPHDIEYHDKGGTASDIRTPFFFTVPPDSEGKHRWIAKLGEKETNPNTPVIINARRFNILVDGSQFEFIEIAKRDNDTLCVLCYKPGVFPDTQRLMKYYENKGVKFTKTGGNSWLGMYIIRNMSAIFVDYRDNYINLAKDDVLYKTDEYEADKDWQYRHYPLYTSKPWETPSSFTPSEIEEGWIKGAIIVQCRNLMLLVERYPGVPPFPISHFHYPTYKFQDNFGNIIEIEFDWFEENWDDWKVKSAIVRYP